ncbi:uncharacterized protein SCHCODRAFT_02613301 [Schizophyllum commune H4-8]|uniref:uncharacterized protein n=1 Tax=Schizophyllum commune (strain H4-8 / FGSC 9210) TaxID=578458 RepID=UPI00215F43BF|nr:uncharacterized protein SCHCODRAFT_02613301 [Schizophyllum commune H4-8]KAI5898836.1 hypothetical protein SCHCODRAFT_02613301 [Schizophyllum commune H4-8]
MSLPAIAVLGAGAMGSKIAHRLHTSGTGSILTNLDGRSPATRQRAAQAGMVDASYTDIVSRATLILSIVPTKEASGVAELVASAYRSAGLTRKATFVDCNAMGPTTMRGIAKVFDGTNIVVIDGSIIGVPPSDTFNPGIYLSAEEKDEQDLDETVELLKKYGLNPFALKGQDASIGAASALKMSHSGIVKGLIGLFYTMILAADRNSPATTTALLHALEHSQPALVDRAIDLVPASISKAYRHIYEMKEVGEFVGGAQSSESKTKAQFSAPKCSRRSWELRRSIAGSRGRTRRAAKSAMC